MKLPANIFSRNNETVVNENINAVEAEEGEHLKTATEVEAEADEMVEEVNRIVAADEKILERGDKIEDEVNSSTSVNTTMLLNAPTEHTTKSIDDTFINGTKGEDEEELPWGERHAWSGSGFLKLELAVLIGNLILFIKLL